MIKRVTKVTSLLIAATSIVSMVPVMAADVQKVKAEDGTVYSAKSNANGTIYIDAELNGEDEAIYSYKDGKYTKVNGAQAGDTIGDETVSDGKKYLSMADYYVNLETGETTDEDFSGNADDDADSALRKVIKSDNNGRFDKLTYTGNTVKAEIDHGTAKGIYGISGWRRYNYTLDSHVTYDSNYTKSASTVYSDNKGNYVDADYNLGKLGVYNTTGAGVTIKNTEDTYKLAVNGTDYEIKAEIQNLSTWDEGPDYITRTAALSIWGTTDGGTTYTNLTGDVYFGSASNNHQQVTDIYTDQNDNTVDCTSIRVMQRISKTQASDKVDGIKYSKDVKTYFITKSDGKVQPLLGLSQPTNAASDSYGYGFITGGTQGYIVSLYHDINPNNKTLYAETINFKSENGYYYTDVSDADSVNVAYVNENDNSTYAWTIGCGDVYALSDGGYVEEFNGKTSSFDKLYKVDGGMNEINVSLPFNVVVWNQDDGRYSVITKNVSTGDKTAVTDTIATTGTTTATTTSAVTAGWAKATDGTWSFVKADGTKATGWYLDGTIWYYLNAAGVMQTGWVNDNGTWYYCNESGAMLANTTVDGYVLGVNGALGK